MKLIMCHMFFYSNIDSLKSFESKTNKANQTIQVKIISYLTF